jgi:hypothetical protein
MTNWVVAQIDLAELAHKAGPVGLIRLRSNPLPLARSNRWPDQLLPSSSPCAPLLDPDAALTADRHLRPAPAMLATIIGHKRTGPR